MSRIVLTLVGALWTAFGVACLVAPASMLSMVGIEPASPQSSAEIRAMYGGAQIGFGAFLLYASRVPQLARAALLVLALVMGGFALGRLSGVVLDGSLDGITLLSLATEVLLFALAAFAFSREGKPLTAGAA